MIKNIKTLLGVVVLTTVIFVVSCSKEGIYISDTKTMQLKFERNINGKSKKLKKYSKNSDFSTYTITLNSSGQLSVNNDELIISEAINKDTGVKSYVITEKESSSLVTLKSLQISAKANSESGYGGIERGYWYDGYDCFIYGTIITADDGTRLFIPADAATRYLMDNCGWSNVG